MPWDSLRELQAWQERLGRQPHDAWTPPIDVYETSDMYVITAEVPGLTREDVDLALSLLSEDQPGIVTSRAFSDDFVCVLRRGHPDAEALTLDRFVALLASALKETALCAAVSL